MVGVSLSPMHNVGIYRPHWAIYQNVLIGNNHVQKNQRAQKTYSECQNFIANGVWPMMMQRWQMKTGQSVTVNRSDVQSELQSVYKNLMGFFFFSNNEII
jgi:hypothetical protein